MSHPLQSFQNRFPVLPTCRPASFASLMQAMLPQLGIGIPPGPASDAYTLHCDDGQSLYVMAGAAQDSMITACVAGQLPPAPSASMLSQLLALNLQAASNIAVVVGLDVPSRTVVVSSQHMLAGMHAALFKDMLHAVRRQARTVRQVLASCGAQA